VGGGVDLPTIQAYNQTIDKLISVMSSKMEEAKQLRRGAEQLEDNAFHQEVLDTALSDMFEFLYTGEIVNS